MADLKKIKCQAKTALYIKGKGLLSSKEVMELSESEYKALDAKFPGKVIVIAEKKKEKAPVKEG